MNTDKLTATNKLSDLIDLAVRDAVACERDPRYRLNMGAWHTPGRDLPRWAAPDKCHVCFAGAVMAQTCGADPGARLDWNSCNFDARARGRFLSLNRARVGDLRGALLQMESWDPSFVYAEGDKQLRAVDAAARLIERNLASDRAPWRVYHFATNALRRAGL